MDGEGLVEAVERAAESSGLVVGVADAGPFPEVHQEMARRVSAGLRARLGFTYRDIGVSTDPQVSFPWARRLVTGLRPYLPEAGSPGPAVPGTGRIARFAVDDHYEPLRRGLGEVAAVLRAAAFRAEVLVDDSRLVDRAAAVRAGIAWWGKSTMALAPGAGPWFLIGSVVTDAPLPPSTPMERGCGSCAACLPACPTGALVAPGVLDARLCLAAVAQAPGVIPRHLREPMGDRIYGCDECLDACPPGHRILAAATRRQGRVDLAGLLETTDETLLAEYGHLYLPRRHPRYLRRNALVALGNAGDETNHPVVLRHLHHPDWLLRAHAVWAVDRLMGPAGLPAIERAAGFEERAEVLAEVAWVVAQTPPSGS